MPLAVQFWYPAAGRYRPRSWTARLLTWRRGFEDVAEEDAALAAAPETLPLVLYFPGWPGAAVDNRFLLTEFASHGYAVAAVTYPQGPGDAPPRLDYSSEAAYRRTVALAEQRVQSRAADAGALLDELTRLRASGGCRALFRRLDLRRVGIAGFSFGGAVAAETATRDARVGAVVNIDGRHWGAALRDGVVPPYLFIGEELVMPGPDDLSSAQPERRYNAVLDQRDYSQLALNLRRNGGMKVSIAGSAHLNFTDAALRRGLRKAPGTGSIEPRRALHIVAAHATQFFDHTLMRRSTHPPPATPRFAEARVEVWQSGVTPAAASTPETAWARPVDRTSATPPPPPPR